MLEINLKPGAKRRSDRAPVKNPIFRKQLGMSLMLTGGLLAVMWFILTFPHVTFGIVSVLGVWMVGSVVWMIAGDIVDK